MVERFITVVCALTSLAVLGGCSAVSSDIDAPVEVDTGAQVEPTYDTGTVDTGEALPLPPLDVVIVIDNTASMFWHQVTLSEGIPAMVDALGDRDWVVRVYASDSWAELHTALPGDPLTDLRDAVQLGADGADGLPNQMIQDVALYDVRQGSDVAVLIVSTHDGNDLYSPQDIVSRYLEAGHNLSVSVLVSPDPVCLSANEAGSRHIALAEHTGGAMGSICRDSYVGTMAEQF